MPHNVALVRKLNEESIELVHGFCIFKRNLLIMIINCKVSGFNFPLLVDHIAIEADHFLYMIHVLEDRLNKRMKEQHG